MATPIIYQDVADGAKVSGGLFAGKLFWLAQRIPARNALKADIEANGGQISTLEKKADYCIMDHLGRDRLPGYISYTFIEQSIKNGALADPQAHLVGPPVGSARPAGSLSQPQKVSRAAYTAEEDVILYKWVRDHESNGGSVSGNELYKQLGAKYPRHTWQSWRDRYIKQLRHKPPAGLHIPNNAPPSPQSDQHGEQPAPQAPKPAATSNPDHPKTSQSHAVPKNKETKSPSTEVQTAANTRDYTVAELEKLFGAEDFEQLYPNVSFILESNLEENWIEWAKADENDRTVEQWTQYFTKIIVPRFERDHPVEMSRINEELKAIKEKTRTAEVVEDETSDIRPELVDSGPEPEPGIALRQGLEEVEDRHQDESRDKHRKSNARRTPPRPAETSSSSMIQHISNAHEKTLKRMRGEDESEKPTKQSPSTKRRRSESLGPITGTNMHTAEILSGVSSSQSGESYDKNDDKYQPEPTRRQVQHGSVEEVIQNQLQPQGSSHEELGESEIPTPTIEREHVPSLLDVPGEPPSNSPTPRASRTKRSAFDTQAILSSPTETLYFGALPLPQQDLSSPTNDKHISRGPTLAHNAPDSSQSSASGLPESDASTTHSIQEFRRSLNEANESSRTPRVNPFDPLPLPHRASPTPSESSSQDSGDPDPPLDVDEIEDFFALQRENGFTTYEIRQALMHTRNRPVLAEAVLEAWRAGKTLPNKRGIWSDSDDEDVDSGDGVALARLERKHTLDGWGGITERTYFLAQWRGD